jgi:hypothetical protein
MYEVPCARSFVRSDKSLRICIDPSILRIDKHSAEGPFIGTLPDDMHRAALRRKRARDLSSVFHVLGDQRVPGPDGTGSETPRGFDVRGLDENVALHEIEEDELELSAGSISGRMVWVPPKRTRETEAQQIAVSYDGTIQLTEGIQLPVEHATKTVRATAFVVPFFETKHPKFHWLTESAFIAFGTWELLEGVVKASFDVYAAR